MPELSLDVKSAADRIAGRVRRTPVLQADPGSFPPAATVSMKLEFLQHTGSFKPRGSLNAVLSAREAGTLPEAGVVIASGGNAGLAAAWAAAACDSTATVFLPANAPTFKVDKLRRLGARVELRGSEYAEAFEAATEFAQRSGALQLHAYDLPDICAGAGTLGLELLEQVGPLDTVVVAVGGGGLMAGVATALRGHARVIGVEPFGVPTLHGALAAGHPVDVAVDSIAADSLGARRLGGIAHQVAVDCGVRSVLVEDAAITEARHLLWDRYRIVVENGAATALAALTSGAYTPAPGERLCVVLCGANTSPI